MATVQLEQLIIGMMVYRDGCMPICKVKLIPDDFVDPSCKRLFEMASAIFNEKGHVDVGEMISPASDEKILAFMLKCGDELEKAILPNLENMIVDLQTESDRRFGYQAAASLANQIKAGKVKNPDEISQRLKAASEALIGRHDRQNHMPLPTLLKNALDGIRNTTDKIWFGLKDIDDATNGIERGELVTIAARTGVGKSALCLYPFVRTGVNGNQWAMFFATEMDAVRMTRRVVANMSGVSQNKIKQLEPMNSFDMSDLARVTPQFLSSKLIFQDQIKYLGQVETAIRIQKEAGKDIRLVIIDYIQQLYIDGYKKSRTQELSEIAGDLLRMAKKFGTTIIIAAQMNRSALIGKGGKLDKWAEPDISQIKDCGSIEQDSDRIIILWQDRQDERMTHCNLAKNREGKRQYFDLDFYGSTMRFYTHVRSENP